MIKGNRVELRPVTAEDMERFFIWRNDEEVAKWAAGSRAATYGNIPLESLQAMYAANVQTANRAENLHQNRFSVYSIDGVHIGSCDYRDVNLVTRSATIGISIGAKDYWSKGYGSDAIHTLLRFLFLKLNLNRVQLDTWSGNIRAIRAYEKLGFVIEGRLRQNEYVDGQCYDTIMMGLLREDFFRST